MSFYSAHLRRELIERATAFAKRRSLPHHLSYGEFAIVAFEPFPDGAKHGNFHDRSYSAILKSPPWARRLKKQYAAGKRNLPKTDRTRWCELDSCNSSDALLMNIFCYPGTVPRLARMMSIEPESIPEFGFRPRVPLVSGLNDTTEVDLELGSLLIEAKLTEAGFQSKTRSYVERYRNLDDVFDVSQLPRTNDTFHCYQLIRNVLAAHHTGMSLCVLMDARRPDLKEMWWSVMRCVTPVNLRLRCKALTWQEVAEQLPGPLRKWLDEKYGTG